MRRGCMPALQELKMHAGRTRESLDLILDLQLLPYIYSQRSQRNATFHHPRIERLQLKSAIFVLSIDLLRELD